MQEGFLMIDFMTYGGYALTGLILAYMIVYPGSRY